MLCVCLSKLLLNAWRLSFKAFVILFKVMVDTPERHLHALLRDARLQKVRDQISEQFEFVAVTLYEKKMVHGFGSDYLHIRWRPTAPGSQEFTLCCDFHLACQLSVVANFLRD